eukprot:486936-Heterocapsa_arctica.AAC.1
MVIERMPGDGSKTVKNRQKPATTFKAIYTCMCTPVGPTDAKQHKQLNAFQCQSYLPCFQTRSQHTQEHKNYY